MPSPMPLVDPVTMAVLPASIEPHLLRMKVEDRLATANP
jgi:hypothetical protein